MLQMVYHKMEFSMQTKNSQQYRIAQAFHVAQDPCAFLRKSLVIDFHARLTLHALRTKVLTTFFFFRHHSLFLTSYVLINNISTHPEIKKNIF